MKSNKLIDAIGMIDDEFINEAHSKKKFKLAFSWELVGKLATAAICLLLIVNIFPELFKSYKSSDSNSNAAYYDTSSYGANSYENGYAYSSDASEDMKSAQDESISAKDLMNDADKKLILNANMYLESQDLDDTNKQLSALVKKYNGYFKSSNMYSKTSYTRIIDACIRIPANNYSSFLEELKTLGNMTSYSEYVDDVTDHYMDIQARLNSLKAQEEKVLEFYEKAVSIEDLMAIESRLSDLRYEIEYYEAQIKNYDLLVEYSTLDLTISETKSYTPTNPSFLSRLVNAFKNGFNNFVDTIGDFLIDVVYNIWTILLLGLIGFVGYIIYKKFKNRRNTK